MKDTMAEPGEPIPNFTQCKHCHEPIKYELGKSKFSDEGIWYHIINGRVWCG